MKVIKIDHHSRHFTAGVITNFLKVSEFVLSVCFGFESCFFFFVLETILIEDRHIYQHGNSTFSSCPDKEEIPSVVY